MSNPRLRDTVFDAMGNALGSVIMVYGLNKRTGAWHVATTVGDLHVVWDSRRNQWWVA